jgi:hypothetical protein
MLKDDVMRISRWIIPAIVLSLVPSGSGLAREGDFILECSGVDETPSTRSKEFQRTYYISLRAGTFCSDSCLQRFPVRNPEQEILDLSFSDPSDGTVAIGWSAADTQFDLQSGQFRSSEANGGTVRGERKLAGRCVVANLELMPVLEFLAKAPAQ